MHNAASTVMQGKGGNCFISNWKALLSAFFLLMGFFLVVWFWFFVLEKREGEHRLLSGLCVLKKIFT